MVDGTLTDPVRGNFQSGQSLQRFYGTRSQKTSSSSPHSATYPPALGVASIPKSLERRRFKRLLRLNLLVITIGPVITIYIP